jgi:hypothetical protein
MRPASLFALITMTLACALFAGPAMAQRDRVFVASYGNDSGSCTFGSPCKTFQYAVDNVAVGGEVTAIDSAGFGPVTISQSVTITSPNGVEAGIVAASGGNAVTINATSAATITLRGLTLEGSGVGSRGISLTSTGGGTLNIIDTVVKDFVNSGIAILPAGGNMNLTISNCYSLSNGGDGIKLAPTTLSAIVNFSIDQTTANTNSSNGIELNASGGAGASGSVTRSEANLNTIDGIFLNAAGATIKNCYVDSNGNYGVSVTNEAAILLSGSELTNNINDGIDTDSVSTTDSFSDNVIEGVKGTITQVSLQ